MPSDSANGDAAPIPVVGDGSTILIATVSTTDALLDDATPIDPGIPIRRSVRRGAFHPVPCRPAAENMNSHSARTSFDARMDAFYCSSTPNNDAQMSARAPTFCRAPFFA